MKKFFGIIPACVVGYITRGYIKGLLGDEVRQAKEGGA